jgi:hypothetical protein
MKNYLFNLLVMIDQVANTLAFIGFSLPTFFTGLLLILVFSVQLDWLPMVYRADLGATGWQWYWEQFKQSVMPVTVLGLFQGASLVRYVRSAVLDVVRLDYVTTARSKGIGERAVIMKHVVRTALIPVVTLIALQLPIVFGGAMALIAVAFSLLVTGEQPPADHLRVGLQQRIIVHSALAHVAEDAASPRAVARSAAPVWRSDRGAPAPAAGTSLACRRRSVLVRDALDVLASVRFELRLDPVDGVTIGRTGVRCTGA